MFFNAETHQRKRAPDFLPVYDFMVKRGKILWYSAKLNDLSESCFKVFPIFLQRFLPNRLPTIEIRLEVQMPAKIFPHLKVKC
jgi:hypothetical protein